MRKLFVALSIMAFAVMGVVVSPKSSEAVPAFARQMNLQCFACHYQHIPKLNAFGRAFKVGGYTDAAVNLIEDDGISLPAVANMAFVGKLRYVKTEPKGGSSSGDKAGSDRGELNIPDEGALWIAGRGGKNVGFAIEAPNGGWANGKLVFVGDLGGVKAGLSVWSTDGMGPGWGMEIANTGFVNSQMAFESSRETLVYQLVQRNAATAGAATGISLYASHPMVFLAAGLWGPQKYVVDTNFDLSHYVRVAVTPSLGGTDLIVGVFYQGGETKCVECLGATTVQTVKTELTGVDVQAQTDLGGMTLEVQGAYVQAGGDASTGKINLYGKGNGFNVNAELGINKVFGVILAYRNYTDKSGASDMKESATTGGVYANIAQNVNLQVTYTSYGDDKLMGKDNKLMTRLFFGL